ncbi:alpha-hydroxy-acid oxidizing protein (plasmid) [Paracoccus denitrificans]|uniref:alpha-hydroxy acid oxidase n=1 Tax=Paracoccus denitrificans TaxID=266 RepID=UPI001E5C3535|nr:alpha-hydroxy acid oxidase [Paracoccus denitrificans]UFS68407.1 alpha-hydroxy-acid oxidizing protein [Paracoccus denitrificans]
MAGQAEIPADVVALCDYERHAAERMPAPLRAYVDGAGADGLTAAANLAAWQAIRLQSRLLCDMRGAHTDLRLFGLDLPHPLILAPVAFHGLAHAEAEHATALGAAATGSLMVVSTQSGLPLEEIAARAQGPLWFQLYMQPRREDTLRLVHRAEAAGYRALVVTLDAPVNGLRNMEQRAGFRLPEGLRAVNLDGMTPPEIRSEPGQAATFLGLMDAAPRWEDIGWLKSQTRLPVLLKGIMSAHDAERAVAVGADGVIVSNHGGRALDGLPATAEALPVVARAIAGRVPVLCDGGIRRGTDALKALALGASAVLIGRPQIHALAVGGAAGVAHMLTILRAELEVAMALTGRRDLAGIDESVIWGT